MSDNISIKAIGPASQLGEGPHWQQEYQALVYVDIESAKIHRYFTNTGRHQQLAVGKKKNLYEKSRNFHIIFLLHYYLSN